METSIGLLTYSYYRKHFNRVGLKGTFFKVQGDRDKNSSEKLRKVLPLPFAFSRRKCLQTTKKNYNG